MGCGSSKGDVIRSASAAAREVDKVVKTTAKPAAASGGGKNGVANGTSTKTSNSTVASSKTNFQLLEECSFVLKLLSVALEMHLTYRKVQTNNKIFIMAARAPTIVSSTPVLEISGEPIPAKSLAALPEQTRNSIAPPTSTPALTTSNDGIDKRSNTKHKVRSDKEKQEKSAEQELFRLVYIVRKDEQDPQVKLERRTEKRAEKLIRYLQKYWDTNINNDFYPNRLTYYTKQLMTHEKDEDHWFKRRALQKCAEHSGMYSNVREPYKDLGKPELDTWTLVLQNLHQDLAIDTGKWFADRKVKEEKMENCNAAQVRPARIRVRKPHVNKGRVKTKHAGIDAIAQFVKTGDQFRKDIRGPLTFSQILERWETEHRTREEATAFGVIKKSDLIEDESTGAEYSTDVGDVQPKNRMSLDATDTDEHRSKREIARDKMVAEFERVLHAVHQIIKSAVNMTKIHLEFPFPLPPTVVTQLRSTSPTRRDDNDYKIGNERMDKLFKDFPCNRYKRKQQLRKLNVSDIEDLEAFKVDSSEEDIEDLQDVETNIDDGGGGDDDVETLHQKDIMEFDDQIGESSTALEDGAEPDSTHLTYSPSKPKMSIGLQGEDPTSRALRSTKAILQMYNKVFNLRQETPAWFKPTSSSLYSSGQLLELAEKLNSPATQSIEPSPEEPDATSSKLPVQDDEPNFLNQFEDVQVPKLKRLVSDPKITSQEQSRLDVLKANPTGAPLETPDKQILGLYKLAGVRMTNRDRLGTVLKLKSKFRNTLDRLKFQYVNETQKLDWDTRKRYEHKVAGLEPCPVYQVSIERMRHAMDYLLPTETEELNNALKASRHSSWYQTLLDHSERIQAETNLRCVELLRKILNYADADVNSLPHMPERFALLTASLPVTEIGLRSWQTAMMLLIRDLLGQSEDLLEYWLKLRSLPLVTNEAQFYRRLSVT